MTNKPGSIPWWWWLTPAFLVSACVAFVVGFTAPGPNTAAQPASESPSALTPHSDNDTDTAEPVAPSARVWSGFTQAGTQTSDGTFYAWIPQSVATQSPQVIAPVSSLGTIIDWAAKSYSGAPHLGTMVLTEDGTVYGFPSCDLEGYCPDVSPVALSERAGLTSITLGFGGDSSALLGLDEDGTIWDLASDARLPTPRPVTALGSGLGAAYIMDDGTTGLWAEIPVELPFTAVSHLCVASPDSAFVADDSGFYRFRTWGRENGAEKEEFPDLGTIEELSCIGGDDGYMTVAVRNTEGEVFFTSASDDEMAMIVSGGLSPLKATEWQQAPGVKDATSVTASPSGVYYAVGDAVFTCSASMESPTSECQELHLGGTR